MGAFIQDLNLTIESSTLIQPLEPTERRTMFLTDIDQSFNFNVKVVLFFSAPNEPLQSVFEKWQLCLAKLLVPYDFLAGRLRVDVESGRLEIDCNKDGASFVVASTDLFLEDIGELGLNNPTMKKLIPMPELEDKLKDQPLLAFQVTCFKCGSYAIGFSINHTTLDGTGSRQFFLNLSSISFGEPHLSIPPFTDRSMLAARSPPRVSFPNPHLTALGGIERLPFSTTPIQNLNNYNNKVALQFREFTLNAMQISFLKDKARNLLDGGVSSKSVITTFNVVTAHIWRSKALATTELGNFDKPSRLIYPVDMRRMPLSPFPPSYPGNGILPAYASATCLDLEVGPFSRIVQMVAEGAERINDDDQYVEYMIDSEMGKGYPIGDVFVTSWRRMAFEEVEFGWGKPTYMCFFPLMGSEMIVVSSGVEKGSITALVGLPDKCMQKFHHQFYMPFVAQPPRV